MLLLSEMTQDLILTHVSCFDSAVFFVKMLSEMWPDKSFHILQFPQDILHLTLVLPLA